MTKFLTRKYSVFLSILIFVASCAYYNTFFNAEENYKMGIEKINKNTSEQLPKDIVTNFEAAISKSWSVIKIYGDSNSWADDALLLIGKSHYQLKEYKKSQEVLEQFLQKYLKSPLRPQAELWLAQTFVKQGNTDKALQNFTSLISNTNDEDILADAYFYIGQIYFDDKDYTQAIKNFLLCIDISGSSETAGNAQYKLADSYYNSKDYENAVINYKMVLHYDLPVIKQFDAVIQTANALIKLEEFDEAREMLLNIMNDQRFKEQYSMIATKLANMFEFEGDVEFAVQKYYDVLQEYPESEGAALASFYLAQIYEFEYGLLDSAKVKYESVKKIYPKSESVSEANERAEMLTTYLAIRDKIKKDKNDLYRIEMGDTLLVDSVETTIDSLNTEVKTDILEDERTLPTEGSRILVQEKETEIPKVEPVKTKKIAINRKPGEIERSLLKNSFNLAEYFLLTYQHYDSAKIAYTNFINNFSDSLLTPKAYYSLYYLDNDIFHDSLSADSLKNIILTRYPHSVYGAKLAGYEDDNNQEENLYIENMFLEAENLVEQANYNEAIEKYNQIAKQDSGSEWALKSRYAAAYIYENYLNDIPNALDRYAVLAKEYPLSEQGKIASKKVAEPPVEKIVLPETTVIDSSVVAIDSLITPQLAPTDSLDNTIDQDE